MSVSLVCMSHSPLMMGALRPADRSREVAFFRAVGEAGKWIAARKPELLVVFAPDHFAGLFYDLMPGFVVAAAARGGRDWGLEPGPLDVPGDVAMACFRHLAAEGFDPAFSWDMRVDHGATIPLVKLTGALAAYPVLPVVVNCAAVTRPGFRRVRELGAAVGRFLAGLGRRAVVIGSGGLSHDPPTPVVDLSDEEVVNRVVRRHAPTLEELERRQARVVEAAKAMCRGEGPILPPSAEFDRRFLGHLMAGELAAFDDWSDEAVDREAGFGGHEVRCWVAAAAALAAASDGEPELALDYYDIIPEWITGMAVMRGAAPA